MDFAQVRGLKADSTGCGLNSQGVRAAHSTPDSVEAFKCQSKTGPAYTVEGKTIPLFAVIYYFKFSSCHYIFVYFVAVFIITDLFVAPLSPVLVPQ